MEELSEPQQEEQEVLLSIYEGDNNFKELKPGVYQYKVGEDGAARSCVLEVEWGAEYPDALPRISLDAFYNRLLLAEVKEAIISKLTEEAEAQIGVAMTYTLFEYLRESGEELLQSQPLTPVVSGDRQEAVTTAADSGPVSDKKEKKVQLTKAQKRRMIDKFGTNQEERPRGWDWVDVVKHLSQTGGAK